MKVAIIGHSRFGVAEPFSGGLEAHTTTIARALQRLGHRVTVFAGPRTAPTPPDLEVIAIVDEQPDYSAAVRLDIAMPAGHFPVVDAAYRRVLLEIATPGRFDVVHNNSLHYLPVCLDVEIDTAMVHLLHCPPFDELHTAHQHRTGSGGSPGAVISVSKSLRRSWGPISGSVILNGVDTHRWWPTFAAPTAQCVWAGRIVAEKAPHRAIEAARRAGRPIVLAGPIQDHAYFDAEVRPRLGDGARWVGHLGTTDLAMLYRQSAVGVATPDWDEPFGLVVAEMLASGVPVAAFDSGGISEFLEPSVGVLAEADNVDSLASAMEEAAGLDRRICRKYAVEHLSVDVVGERYVALYREQIREQRS